jgi:hypothetical protein
MKPDPPLTAFKTSCFECSIILLSPYSTADDPPGVMKWFFETHYVGFYGSTAIDLEGTISVIITRPVNGIYLMDTRILLFCKPVHVRENHHPSRGDTGTIWY